MTANKIRLSRRAAMAEKDAAAATTD